MAARSASRATAGAEAVSRSRSLPQNRVSRPPTGGDVARVLVADDEPAIVMAIRDELLFEGFEVEAVGTGMEAIASARSWKPDVLILDLMLPGMNGFEVCRTLRREQRHVWIIMLTVRAQ